MILRILGIKPGKVKPQYPDQPVYDNPLAVSEWENQCKALVRNGSFLNAINAAIARETKTITGAPSCHKLQQARALHSKAADCNWQTALFRGEIVDHIIWTKGYDVEEDLLTLEVLQDEFWFYQDSTWELIYLLRGYLQIN